MNEKILVVDDEEAILLGVGDLLASEGYRVSTARDGREALERFAADRPDLVLLDVMMPEMSGYDVCRAIRRTDPLTPVLMLTAKAEEVDKVVGLELGADDYVVKPFGTGELTARVHAALRRATARASRLDDRAELPPIAFARRRDRPAHAEGPARDARVRGDAAGKCTCCVSSPTTRARRSTGRPSSRKCGASATRARPARSTSTS